VSFGFAVRGEGAVLVCAGADAAIVSAAAIIDARATAARSRDLFAS
jgi:hypothetical protein